VARLSMGVMAVSSHTLVVVAHVGGRPTWNQVDTATVKGTIDTSSCKVSKAPTYFSQLRGWHSHWTLSGMNSVYSPTSANFVIRLSHKPHSITAKQATDRRYEVEWCGVVA